MFAVMMKGMVAHLRGDTAASGQDLQRVADFHQRIHSAVSAFLPSSSIASTSVPSALPTPPTKHDHPRQPPISLPHPQVHQAQSINLLNFSSPLFSRRTTVTSQNDSRAPST